MYYQVSSLDDFITFSFWKVKKLITIKAFQVL